MPGAHFWVSFGHMVISYKLSYHNAGVMLNILDAVLLWTYIKVYTIGYILWQQELRCLYDKTVAKTLK